jgi:NADH dehydrogenase
MEITLVSQENFFLFSPMLHEVAACDLDLTHIVSPLRTLLRRNQTAMSQKILIAPFGFCR